MYLTKNISERQRNIVVGSHLAHVQDSVAHASERRVDAHAGLLGNFLERKVLKETHIIVAKPGASETLTTLHRRIAEKHGEDLDPWTKGDRWYPHTTLLYRPDADLEQICSVMARHFSPFHAKVVRFELSRVLPDGYEIVDQIALLPQ